MLLYNIDYSNVNSHNIIDHSNDNVASQIYNPLILDKISMLKSLWCSARFTGFFSSNLHLCVWTFIKARQVFCKMSSKTVKRTDTWISLHWTFAKVAVCFVYTGTLQNSLLFMSQTLTEFLWENHWREKKKKKKKRLEKTIKHYGSQTAKSHTTLCAHIINTLPVA